MGDKPPLSPFVSYLLAHQPQIALTGAILSLATCLIWRKVRKAKIMPDDTGLLMQLVFAGISISQGAVLLYLCYHPEALVRISDIPLFVGIASLCAMYVGLVTIWNASTKD